MIFEKVGEILDYVNFNKNLLIYLTQKTGLLYPFCFWNYQNLYEESKN